jgi:hypothetical protein
MTELNINTPVTEQEIARIAKITRKLSMKLLQLGLTDMAKDSDALNVKIVTYWVEHYNRKKNEPL